MTIAEAITEFRAAAITKADFAKSPASDHALHARMAAAFHFLASQGLPGRTAFDVLLTDESGHIRLWVAAQLLSERDTRALAVVEQFAASSGSLAFDAAITLREFHTGRLRSPFSTPSPNHALQRTASGRSAPADSR